MNVEISYYSSTGDREVNEDTVSVLQSGNSVLALVADGLGGQGGGDVASQAAVASVNGDLNNAPLDPESMTGALAHANTAVLERQRGGVRMMTTIAAVWMQRHAAVLANVGDSRIYQIREGRIIYQSVDHSLAQMAVYVGEISADQIRDHVDRNRLVRALGADSRVKPDVNMVTVKQGDIFLLCSDGFWEQITEEEMLRLLRSPGSISAWLETMREYIRTEKNTRMDNHSAIVLKVQE